MDLVNSWVMDIVGPPILLILLIWLVIRAGTSRSADTEESEQTNHDTGPKGEQPRNGRTGGL